MKKSDIIYSVAVGIRVYDTIIDIKKFSGNKSECIDFINKEYSQKYLKSLRKSKIVINLCYTSDSSIDEWLTLEELNELGGIKLK